MDWKSLRVLVTELWTLLHRWQKVASYLNASVAEAAGLQGCVDHEEVWRGALVIREKKVGTFVCLGKTHSLPLSRTKCCASVPCEWPDRISIPK